MVVIEPYDAKRDAEAVFALWQAALGKEWPLTMELFLNVVNSSNYWENCHFVARDGQAVVGFVATQLERSDGPALPTEARIAALFVSPERQRQGVGTLLHRAALRHLSEMGADNIQLGGGLYRFWPGVPANLEAAMAFFQALGWEFNDSSYDLTQDLGRYETPEGTYLRPSVGGLSLRTVTPEDVPRVLDFVRDEFPSWLTAYRDVVARGDYQDILVAYGPDSIEGLLIMYSSRGSHRARADVVWHELLGQDLGALGTVGVASARRGKGIGLALVARGSEILKARGVGRCHISWVVLLDFYGKLGYKPWRSYKMSWRSIAP